MRLTEDGHMVDELDSVFEIQYRRLNEEVSIAEPTWIIAHETDRRIWKHRMACAIECLKINNTPRWEPLTQEIPTIKLIADDSKGK